MRSGKIGLKTLCVSFFILFGVESVRADEFHLELVKKNVAQDQITPILNLLKTAEALLPPTLKEKIGRKIFVDFALAHEAPALTQPNCPGVRQAFFSEPKPLDDAAAQIIDYGVPTSGKIIQTTYGQTVGNNRIFLNRAFIPEIIRGPELSKTYPCGHKTLYRLILATLLHEVAHLYDFSPAVFFNPIISSETRFQRLAGWSRHGIWNQMTPNHPSRREAQTPMNISQFLRVSQSILNFSFWIRNMSADGQLCTSIS